jgi:hypothetical protein
MYSEQKQSVQRRKRLSGQLSREANCGLVTSVYKLQVTSGNDLQHWPRIFAGYCFTIANICNSIRFCIFFQVDLIGNDGGFGKVGKHLQMQIPKQNVYNLKRQRI